MATKQLRVDLSLPWYESRRLRCCICDTLLLFSQLADHLKSNHDCTYTGYKLMFPSSCPDLPPWKCQICSHKTPWTRRNIHHHLNAKHEMSIEDYGTEYVEDMKADSVEEAIIKENVDEAIVKMENGEVPSTSSTRPVKLEARESTPSKKTMSRDMVKVGSDEKLWVPWFESRLHKCNLCGEVRTCGLSFKNHIYDKHQFMSRKQYCQRFPHADIEPKAWNCSLCRNTVKWTKKCIVDHLKTAHAMSRDDFETMFNMPAKHMIDAPAGGKYDVNARTDLGLANKAGTTTENVSLEDLCEVASKAEENAALEDLCELAIEEKNDSSRVQCGLCDDQVGSLADHVRDYHHMGKEAYLKICPSDAARFAQKKRSQVWTCRICEETMENSQENVKNHLDVHAIDIKDYDKTFDTSMADEEEEEEIVLPDAEIVMGEVEENTREHSSERDSKPIEVESSEEEPGRDSPWYEAIKITCEECHNSFWLGQFMKHIILTHKLPIKVYKAKYPETIIPKRQYTCRVCGCGVSHYASPISGHLTGRHNMTMTEYYEKYEKLQVEPPELTPALVVDLPDSSFALETAEEDNANLDNPNIKNQRMAEFQKSGKIPWYECKTTICRFCGEEWLLGSFRRHLYDRHDKVSRTAYAEMFPDADITLPTWTCKICRNGVRWVRDNIFYHLRTHNFTMEGYRQLYIDGNGPPPTSPSNKPIPNLVPIKAEAHEGKQFRCKLCSMLVAFESGSIKNHLKTFHNMSINDYQPISHVRSFGGAPQGFSPGAPGFSPGFPMTDNFLDVAAPPANMGLGFSPSIFGPMPNLPMPPQLQKMAEPLGSGQPWYNRCKWTCNVCDKAFSSGFWRHVQEAHSTKKEDYLREYGKKGIEIIHYFCKICSKKVPWSGASINAHMKGEHGKTLKEYELEYGPDTEPIVVPQQVLEIPNMPLYKTLPRLHQFANQNQQIHYVHSSNNWFNGCEYKCQICSRVLYSVAGLSMHLKDTHMLDKFAYFREYGRAGINIRKYKCKICFKSFPWSGVSISKHVKQAHQVSLQRYSAMYEQGSTTKSIADQDDGFFSPEDAAAAPEAASTPHAKDKVKWYNKCSWTCQICGTTITSNSSAFYKHVVQDHGTPIEEYKEKFGNTGFVFVDHTCKLCQKKIPFNGLSMCKHMKHSHNMQLEEYQQRYMKDDDGTSTGEYYAPTDEFWYNKCIWKCQLCGNKNKSLGSSKKHIQKVHNLTYEDYNDRYGNEGIFEVDFKCKLCRATISCNGVTIASHLLNNHKLTLKEYEKQYLVNGVDAEEDAPEAGPQDGEHFLTGSSKSRSCSPITARDAAAQKDKTWYQKCKYICQICKNPYFSISALRNHTKVKHGMDRDTYVGIYGVDAGKVIEDYICKICNRTLKCEGRSLNAHMRNCHKMGILEYSKKYEATKGTDEDPNLYSEHYQIEMDNDEAAEETQVEDMDESTDELINPLASLVSAELHEEEDVEEDMTAEESLHFNFEEDDEDPDQTLEVKPDIHQLDLEMEMDMVDTTTEYEEGEATFEENQSINEEGVADFDEEGMGTVSMGVIEYDDDAEL